jgi:hypothetical protein
MPDEKRIAGSRGVAYMDGRIAWARAEDYGEPTSSKLRRQYGDI